MGLTFSNKTKVAERFINPHGTPECAWCGHKGMAINDYVSEHIESFFFDCPSCLQRTKFYIGATHKSRA